MAKYLRIAVVAAGLLFASAVLFAQTDSSSPAPASAPAASSAVDSVPAAAVAKPAAKAEEEEDDADQFKYSPTVRSVAVKTGLSKEAVYWLFFSINFLILAAGAVWVVRKAMPNGFAPRTAEIQKGIEEARKASADATAKLTEIEGRLAKLDAEIAEIRSASEGDFSAEEQRIKDGAEQDARAVISAAEQEISAAARAAQRDLKAFAAGLAVDLAETKINVDGVTDEALVRGFDSQLGKDGRSSWPPWPAVTLAPWPMPSPMLRSTRITPSRNCAHLLPRWTKAPRCVRCGSHPPSAANRSAMCWTLWPRSWVLAIA